MPPPVQVPARFRVRVAATAIIVAFLAGCAGKIDATSLGIDDSIHTGSVQAERSPAADIGLDALTIRNAVTSADLPALDGRPLAWANAETGSSGNVSRIDEFVDTGATCRRFVASRQNFEGILLYRGETCLRERGNWQLRQFQSVDPDA